jgi:hypothetical protein
MQETVAPQIWPALLARLPKVWRVRPLFVSLASFCARIFDLIAARKAPRLHTITNSPAPPTEAPKAANDDNDSHEPQTPSIAASPRIQIARSAVEPRSLREAIAEVEAPDGEVNTPQLTMAERALQTILTQLQRPLPYAEASALLSKAKLSLLQLKALTPTPQSSPATLALARDIYEAGAFASIRARNPDAFLRYVSQLQPFYELDPKALKPNNEGRNKVTGLYLLLLLTQGRYAEFHSELEALGTRDGVAAIENDRYLGYPVKLERWLMEGSYDRVWKAMKKGEVPSEEFGVFSGVCYDCLTFSLSVNVVLIVCCETDLDVTDPLRDRLLLGACLPVPTSVEHQVPALPRLGGRSGRLRTGSWLGHPRRSHLLPRGGGRGCGGEGCVADGH